jgi:hypothetical protein
MDLVRQRTQTTRTRARQLAHTGRSVMLGDELTAIVRTMFVLYTLLIVGGIVVFVIVGLTQQ